MKFENIIAIVTGGASGLGQATVEAIVAAGGKAAIFDLNEESGNAMVEQLGANAIFAKVDVADEDSVRAGIDKTITAFGALHLCVNCAGISSIHKTLGKNGPFPLDAFRKVVDINLIGTFNVLRLAAEQMAKNELIGESGERGVIINTASAAAFDGQTGQAGYTATKAAIVGMALPIARDLAWYGIRVNTIAPGIIRTAMFDSAPKELADALTKNVQFPKRLGHTTEFSSTVRHIVENAYINAETIRLDGAMRLPAR